MNTLFQQDSEKKKIKKPYNDDWSSFEQPNQEQNDDLDLAFSHIDRQGKVRDGIFQTKDGIYDVNLGKEAE